MVKIKKYLTKIDGSLADKRPDILDKWDYEADGYLKPEMFSSLIDKVKTLKEENKNRQTEIEQLRQRVTSLENQVQQLWNAVNKMSSTT